LPNRWSAANIYPSPVEPDLPSPFWPWPLLWRARRCARYFWATAVLFRTTFLWNNPPGWHTHEPSCLRAFASTRGHLPFCPARSKDCQPPNLPFLLPRDPLLYPNSQHIMQFLPGSSLFREPLSRFFSPTHLRWDIKQVNIAMFCVKTPPSFAEDRGLPPSSFSLHELVPGAGTCRSLPPFPFFRRSLQLHLIPDSDRSPSPIPPVFSTFSSSISRILRRLAVSEQTPDLRLCAE